MMMPKTFKVPFLHLLADRPSQTPRDSILKKKKRREKRSCTPDGFFDAFDKMVLVGNVCRSGSAAAKCFGNSSKFDLCSAHSWDLF